MRGAGPVKAVGQDVEITAARVLHMVQSGMGPAVSPEAPNIQSPSAARIVETFRARFANACDAGVLKRLSNAVLEPANPFDVKAGRELRQEVSILGTLIFTALGLAVHFNLHAIAR
jgi:hypothetical protein